MENFAIRTVKNGTVKINHNTYKVSEIHMKYDGSLDGLRFAFGLYKNDDTFVSLCGTERAFKTLEDTMTGAHIVDGKLPWMWWNKINP